MTTAYARYIDAQHVQYPSESEFSGVPNWRCHDALLRRKKYLQLVGEPEDRPGFDAVPVEFLLVPGERIDIVRWDYRATPVPEAPTVEDYDAALEDRLREVREARGYTSRDPSEYLGSGVERWAQDARDWIAFRDSVMLFALDIMNQYTATGVAPVSLAEFKSRLGVMDCQWTME